MAVRNGTGAKAPANNTSGSARKGRGKKSSGKKAEKSWAVLFWLAFAILMVGLFLFNRETISAGIQTIQNEMAARNGNSGYIPPEPVTQNIAPPVTQPVTPSEPKPSTQVNPGSAAPQPVPEPPVSSPRQAPASQPVPAASQTAPQARPSPAQPAAQAPSRPASQNAPAQNARNPAELRDRVLYFTQVDRGGSILRVKVDRKIPLSDSPMTDAIQALIAGPNGDEKGRGLISLVPPATRILSATVRGNTAYINFSEDFQYNTYGVEGYAGQLRQIVYTVTEFSNIKDVQILIEGRRVDYLGEGIWIGSPISRDML